MKPSDVLDMTIPELDDLFEGFSKANEDTQQSTGKSKTLKDYDAIKHLIANKDIF